MPSAPSAWHLSRARGAKGHREGQNATRQPLCHAARLRHGDEARHWPRPFHLSPTVCTWSVALKLPPRHRACCARVPHRGPPSSGPMHTGGMRRSRIQDGEAIRLSITTPGAPSDATRTSRQRITVAGTAGDLHPILPNAQENRAFVRLAPPSEPSIKPSICYHAKGPRLRRSPR